MASPSELSLDCKPHSYSMLLKSFAELNQTDQTYKLEEFLSRLEDERLKIDAFKRELPICMQLLTNAVEAYRQHLQASRTNQGGARPVLEEFIPIKHSTPESSSNISDKANWMTSAQLWSQTSDHGTKSQSTNTSLNEPDLGFNVSPKFALDNKQRNGGAFLPFSKERNSCHGSTLQALPELALSSADKNMEDKKCSEQTENGISCQRREIACSIKEGNGEQVKGAPNPSETQTNNSTNPTTNTNPTHRKARRCWSPDLHRKFVNALQMLGGSQVATPKQIRELMKVDGLTNDEVKSHLQKYRLHTRRPSPSPQASGVPPPQLVVLGSIWVPPEYATAAAAATHSGATTLYGHGSHPTSHTPPTHYCTATPVAQEFYTAAPPHPPLPPQPHYHHALHHQQIHMYKTASYTHISPESEIRGAGDRSESIEDGKSESSSWKGESGENEAERKGLAALREDGGESNKNEITLKF
ncbi:Myb-like transcription factor family protein [Quillaja saponaria]|uniref:Myb-like transcription factor family protein n=1 Tax=Quillaja saponaria TaxID=32244 RepID=A0AAD7QC81_QUISA|nr:Myb-like transcription factor family protein [Quillaja saponaria]